MAIKTFAKLLEAWRSGRRYFAKVPWRYIKKGLNVNVPVSVHYIPCIHSIFLDCVQLRVLDSISMYYCFLSFQCPCQCSLYTGTMHSLHIFGTAFSCECFYLLFLPLMSMSLSVFIIYHAFTPYFWTAFSCECFYLLFLPLMSLSVAMCIARVHSISYFEKGVCGAYFKK